MRGTIVINADAGRALCNPGTDLVGKHVIDCSGNFQAGDKVHVVVRAENGNQSVIATGVVRCDESLLPHVRHRPKTAHAVPSGSAAAVVVIPAQDLNLLWRA